MRSLVLIFAVGVLTAGARAGAVAGDENLERWLGLLERLDDAPLQNHHREVPLARVLDDLAERSALPIVGDWRSLDRLGIDPRDDVTLPEGIATVGAALRAIAFQLADEFERPIVEAYADQILLTTREAATAMRATDAYDVRDLLTAGETLTRLRAIEPALDPALDPADPGVASPDDDAHDPPVAPAPADPSAPVPITLTTPEINRTAPSRPTPRTAGEELMMLVVEHVDPEAWVGIGGHRAAISERDGVLLVTAAPSTHRAIRSTLDRLRAISPRGLSVEAFIVEGDRRTIESLVTGHRYRPEGFADALAGGNVALLWRTSSAIVVGRSFETEATAENIVIDLRLRPRFDPAVGRLTLDVALTTRSGVDERRVETTDLVPRRRGLLVIELPAANAPDGPWRGLVVAVTGAEHR